MLKRISRLWHRYLQWRAENEEWTKEHELTWPPAKEKLASGLNAFQEMCEKAVCEALRSEGLTLRDRRIEGKNERYILAVIKEPNWALGIYEDAADIWAKPATLVRIEEWDTKTPKELVQNFTDQMLARVKEWKKSA